MNSTFKRRLFISDGMILVATTAVSLACVREFETQTRFWQPHALARPLQASVWAALPLTLALIPLRLRLPRPRTQRLWRQPGWLASIAVAVSVVHFLALVILDEYFSGSGRIRARRGARHRVAAHSDKVLLYRRGDMDSTRPQRSLETGEELDRLDRTTPRLVLDHVSDRAQVMLSSIGGVTEPSHPAYYQRIFTCK